MIHNDIAKFIGLKPVAYYDLELVLGKLLNGDDVEYLKMLCTGVTEINFGELEGMFGLLVNIEDIRDRQLWRGRIK